MLKRARTMTAKLKIENVTNTNIDHSKEALISPFKLALIEYLYGHNRRVFDSTEKRFVNKPIETCHAITSAYISKLSFQ